MSDERRATHRGCPVIRHLGLTSGAPVRPWPDAAFSWQSLPCMDSLRSMNGSLWGMRRMEDTTYGDIAYGEHSLL